MGIGIGKLVGLAVGAVLVSAAGVLAHHRQGTAVCPLCGKSCDKSERMDLDVDGYLHRFQGEEQNEILLRGAQQHFVELAKEKVEEPLGYRNICMDCGMRAQAKLGQACRESWEILAQIQEFSKRLPIHMKTEQSPDREGTPLVSDAWEHQDLSLAQLRFEAAYLGAASLCQVEYLRELKEEDGLMVPVFRAKGVAC